MCGPHIAIHITPAVIRVTIAGFQFIGWGPIKQVLRGLIKKIRK
jgi:hypothetical protein